MGPHAATGRGAPGTGAGESSPNHTHDVVGVGFGPANLALAVALRETSPHAAPCDAVFVERQRQFAWHPGMLLPGATMQVSFLKDLATMVNPRSQFTMLNYLHLQGRLEHFVNLATFHPTRLEYNQYLTWAAKHFESSVRYGSEVVAIESAGLDRIAVQTRCVESGATQRLYGRNLILASGGAPKFPAGVQVSDPKRIFHSSQFLTRLGPAYPDLNAPYRFAVVGSGQSAAEIFHYLYTRYPNATVTLVCEEFAFKSVDGSRFLNEVFYPEHVDYFYGLAAAERSNLLKTVADTNYSVVDAVLLDAIYADLYADRVAGGVRTRILPLTRVQSATVDGDVVSMTARNHATGEVTSFAVDCAVMATGYARQAIPDALGGLRQHLVLDEAGAPRVRRDYRVEMQPSFKPAIYVQGYAEASHGISDTLLSLLSTRAQIIARALTSSRELADGRRSGQREVARSMTELVPEP